MSNALYFPYIRVPEGPWLTRALLYYDTVGAIVPWDHLEDPDRLGQYMVDLVKEDLVQQVIPGVHLWKLPNFAPAFLEHIDRKYGADGEPATWASVHSEKLGSFPVHMEKLHDLVEELCERGLARKNEEEPYSPWVEIEARVANEFMAYLAAVLGQLPDETKFAPITNERRHLRPLLSKDPERLRASTREVVLRDLLPSPVASIEPGRLREFKEERGDELRRFRRHIESKVSELVANPDDDRRELRLEDMKGEFRESFEELSARMLEQRGWPEVTFGTLCAALSGALAAWKAVLEQDWAWGATGAALGLAPVVWSAFKGADLDLEDRPLAYAALARTELA